MTIQQMLQKVQISGPSKILFYVILNFSYLQARTIENVNNLFLVAPAYKENLDFFLAY